ncbi:hypothetical protein LCGC14_1773650 [marine sediment metagenome]|uniref:Uncharacterized protein n=1 Tax=marine sediment metagenome TaxID=412755 RepID=A0A0F9JCF7_9ZZZZ
MKKTGIPSVTLTSARKYTPVNDIREHEIVAPADSEEVNYGYWPSKWVTIKEFREMYPWTGYYSPEAIIGFLDEYRSLWELKTFVTHEDWDTLKVQKPDPGKVSGDKQTREAVKVIDQYMDTLQ